MDYLIAGLLGVVVGAVVTLIVTLFLLQARADRDLLERRLRALLEYHDSLSAYDLLFDASGQPHAGAVGELARNLDGLTREFHLTAWLFDEPVRARLAVRVEELERSLGRLGAATRRGEAAAPDPDGSGDSESGPAGHPLDGHFNNGHAAHRLEAVLRSCRRLDAELQRVARMTLRDHRQFRFLPGAAVGRPDAPPEGFPPLDEV